MSLRLSTTGCSYREERDIPPEFASKPRQPPVRGWSSTASHLTVAWRRFPLRRFSGEAARSWHCAGCMDPFGLSCVVFSHAFWSLPPVASIGVVFVSSWTASATTGRWLVAHGDLSTHQQRLHSPNPDEMSPITFQDLFPSYSHMQSKSTPTAQTIGRHGVRPLARSPISAFHSLLNGIFGW